MSAIRSKIHTPGNEKESEWPSQFGIRKPGRYVVCKTNGQVMPIQEARKLDRAEPERRLANISHGYIPDEMPPTESPIDGTVFTSKKALRTQYKQHGYEEVGTAYENGYEPEKEAEKDMRNHSRNIMDEIKERMNHG